MENLEDEIVQIEESKILDSKKLNESNISHLSDEEEHEDHGDYCPKRALVNALSDWLPTFNTSGAGERVDLEDLLLLSDFFFLPYEYGKEAKKCVKMLEFIAANTNERQSKDWKKTVQDIRAVASRIERVAGESEVSKIRRLDKTKNNWHKIFKSLYKIRNLDIYNL